MSKENIDLIKLDVGCGKYVFGNDWVGLDKKNTSGVVSIVHDIETTPWPLRDNSCLEIRLSKVLEYINPSRTLDVFDEAWRLLVPLGSLYVYANYGSSSALLKDPLATRVGLTEETFDYLDPRSPLYQVYEPKPYEVRELNYEVDRFVSCRLIPVKRLQGDFAKEVI